MNDPIIGCDGCKATTAGRSGCPIHGGSVYPSQINPVPMSGATPPDWRTALEGLRAAHASIQALQAERIDSLASQLADELVDRQRFQARIVELEGKHEATKAILAAIHTALGEDPGSDDATLPGIIGTIQTDLGRATARAELMQDQRDLRLAELNLRDIRIAQLEDALALYAPPYTFTTGGTMPAAHDAALVEALIRIRDLETFHTISFGRMRAGVLLAADVWTIAREALAAHGKAKA